MATRRSNRFDPHVDQSLLSLLESVPYDGYDVDLISGYRAKTPANPHSRHGHGGAIDVELVDQKTGRRVPNYQSADAFKTYQAYANKVYQTALQRDPELAKKLAWGGYFSGPKGKYGAMDLMHFDTGGMQAGGNWQGGLTPQQAALWGLQPGGGIGSAPMGPKGQETFVPPPVAPAGPDGPKGQEMYPQAPAAGTADADVAPQQPASFWDSFKKDLGKMGDASIAGMSGGGQPARGGMPTPAAARLDQPEVPIIDPQGSEQQRQMLAQAMARLNSGRLF